MAAERAGAARVNQFENMSHASEPMVSGLQAEAAHVLSRPNSVREAGLSHPHAADKTQAHLPATKLEHGQALKADHKPESKLGFKSEPKQDQHVRLEQKHIPREVKALELHSSNGDYLVKRGDTLESIAKRALVLRGHKEDIKDHHKVVDEIARIAANNVKWYAWLAKDPHKLKPFMILDVADKSVGPDPTSEWKPWRSAREGVIENTQKGDRVVAMSGHMVIVQPGVEAIFNQGSKGIVLRGGHARVLPGATVINVEGRVDAEPGSNVKYVSAGEADFSPSVQKAVDNPEQAADAAVSADTGVRAQAGPDSNPEVVSNAKTTAS